MRALLISTFEMGRQPFGLASPAAWLREAGWDVVCADVSRQRLDAQSAAGADLIGFYLPMHTATRLAEPIIRRLRASHPTARLCAYGLYAPLNAEWLRDLGVNDVLGGEFEADLVGVAKAIEAERRGRPLSLTPTHTATGSARVPRLVHLIPDRTGLPPLDRYASLQWPDGTQRVAGYTEASRGCRHLCRHCPVVPVYDGQFRIVAPDVVMADIARQVEAGATHITFGDPDFFNGPTHAMRVVDALHAAHPTVTYDVTIKVEHLLTQKDRLSRLRDTGCAFVTTAVESLDDAVLDALQKGHTRADFERAVMLCRGTGLTLAPTFVAFHPWTTMASFVDLLESIDRLDLVDHVAPIQLAIRLLIPRGSRLLDLPEIAALAATFDPVTLTHRWAHPDPRVDRLQEAISRLVGVRLTGSRRELFAEICALTAEHAGQPVITRPRPIRDRATVPYLNEPWYC